MKTTDITLIFDNSLKSIDNNKNSLILILILLGIYYFDKNNAVQCLYLFDNKTFKFAIFIIIAYILSSTSIIGISLALVMFVSLQIITYIKFKKELDDDINDIKL